MENTYYSWDDFVSNFGREMREACELHAQMTESGCKHLALASFDFTFESDSEEKLAALAACLRERYLYQVGDFEADDDIWELNGTATDFPVTEDHLMYWVLDMAKLGYEFDAKFSGYGALVDGDDAKYPELGSDNEDRYFDLGVAAYDAGNRSGALINWSLVIAINPSNGSAYYSRAIVKADLHTWKAALRDYDEAIKLNPTHLAALVNRGALKDENDDADGAIADYNKVIEVAGDDTEQLANAFFNRGNTKLRLQDDQGACEDWKKARDLGAEYAAERIQAHCRDDS